MAMKEIDYTRRPDGSFYVTWVDAKGFVQQRVYATFAQARAFVLKEKQSYPGADTKLSR